MMHTVNAVAAAVPFLEKSSSPSIVLISSVSGFEVDFAAGSYGAIKAALIHYAKGLSRQLVTLKTDVPIKMDWKGWRIQEWDAPRLLELFRSWGFHRFADQVRASLTTKVEAGGSKIEQGDLFAAEAAEGGPAEPAANGAAPPQAAPVSPAQPNVDDAASRAERVAAAGSRRSQTPVSGPSR